MKDGRAFLSHISCEREGGVVYRKLTWDNYFSSDRCYPKELDNIEDMIDLETLLQKGKEDHKNAFKSQRHRNAQIILPVIEIGRASCRERV